MIRARAALRKEALEAARAVLWHAPLMAALAVFLEWFTAREYARAPLPPSLLGPALARSIVLTVPMVLLTCGSAVLARGFAEERYRHALAPLLSTGASPATLWTAKLAVAFGLGWLAAAGFAVASVALLRGGLGLTLAFGPSAWGAALGVAPAVALGPLALAGLLFWAWPRGAFLASFAPILLGLVLWSRVPNGPAPLPGARPLALALAASGALVFASGAAVSRIPRRWLAGP